MPNMTTDTAILEIDNFLCKLKQDALQKPCLVPEYVKGLSREALEYRFTLALMHMENLIRSKF